MRRWLRAHNNMKAFTLMDLAFLSALSGGGSSGVGLTGLEAWWKLDETTGDRIDAHNGYVLAPYGGDVPSQAGQFGNAAQLDIPADDSLRCADAGLDAEGAITVHFWFKWISGSGHIVSRLTDIYDDHPGGWIFYYLNSADTPRLHFGIIGPDGGNSNFRPIDPSVWNFFAAAHDPARSKLLVSLNAEPWVEVAYTGGLRSTAQPLILGKPGANFGTCKYAMDDLALWKNRVLTSSELASIMGDTYPPFTEEPPVSPLLTNLVAYWHLEEASGDRVDATGNGHDLTPHNSVSSATGIGMQANSFVADNGDYLSLASTDDLKPGAGSFSFFAWVYATSNVPAGIFTKWADNTIQEYALYIGLFGLRYPALFVSGDGSTQHYVVWPADVPTNTWTLIVCVYDHAAGKIKISMNGGDFVVADHSGGIYAGGNAEVHVGKDQTNTKFNGRIDEVGFYKGRALTQEDVTALYNGGAGFFYPFES